MIFSRFILSSLLFFIGGKTVAQAMNGHTRSNVLWIYLEDVNGWFSCYGETLIETPNIDALAELGTRFTRFYTPAGICSATRSALITGMMQTSIGAHNHHSCRPEKWGHSFRTKYDKNVLPDYAKPLPIRFR